MENAETNNLVKYPRSNVKSKTIANPIFIPLDTKEKKLIHNESTKINIHNNNYSSSVDIKKHNFMHKKNVTQLNFFSKNNSLIQLNDKEREKKEHNISKRSIYKILVAVRCRPLSEREKEISPKETVQIIDKKIIKMKDPNGFLNPNNIRSKEQILEFDYAFNNKDNQETIFNCTTKPLIEGIINGFNAAVFAYGATGAGKTYTMLGDDNNPGIMPLAFGELFKLIKNYSNREYLIKLCYLEIYNENIRDLLINSSANLELREDPNKGLVINGITEIIANSGEHILSILKKGNKKRTTEATNSNQTSSRSHAILQIMVSCKEKKK
jgi:kinesin family protein 18/19